MIKLKTFPIDQHEEANKFLESQLPFTTEKGQGIQIHQGHIVVFYNDGIYNELYSKQKFTDLLNKELESLALFEHNLRRHEFMLKEEAPAGYAKGMTDIKIEELCLVENPSKSEVYKDKKYAKDRTNERVKAIVEIENQLLMTMHSIEHSKSEVELYKKTIASYK